jgi:hypothetical protein
MRRVLACARALLDELEARLGAGEASRAPGELVGQAADELAQVAKMMKTWSVPADADATQPGAEE